MKIIEAIAIFVLLSILLLKCGYELGQLKAWKEIEEIINDWLEKAVKELKYKEQIDKERKDKGGEEK